MYELAIELSESGREWLIDKPLEIGMYVVLAIVVRLLLHRAIGHLVRGAGGPGPATRRRFGIFGRRPAVPAPVVSGSGAEPGANADSGPDFDSADEPHELAAAPSAGKRSRAGLPLGRRPRGVDPEKQKRDREVRARRAQRAETIGSVLKSAVSFLVLVWVVIQSLAILGVNVAPLIASAGVVGVALGFGAQNLVRDFISGIFMLVEDQYGVGDVVDVGDVIGTVETMGLRVTTLRDVQGTLWYVRNGEILRVANYSQEYAVAFLQLPISYTADIDEACRVALEVATEAVKGELLREDVLGPPEMLGVDGATADQVSIRLTVRVRANHQWAVERELRRLILRAFDEHDIAPPYRTGLPVTALREAFPAKAP